MIDDRRAAILRAVVQQYIETSQPVSSAHVSHAAGIGASSATVRSEMAALEREGFLVQPHTSAGRIPTDRGYRFFVDQLDGPGMLGAAQQQNVRTFFAKASGEIEQMLHETGKLLSNLTSYAAVVVGPDHESSAVRSVQLVTLNADTALVVVVFANGVVDKHTVELEPSWTQATVAAANSVLSAHVGGHLSGHLSGPLGGNLLGDMQSVPSTGSPQVDALVATTLAAVQGEHQEDGNEQPVYVGGASRLADAFDAVEVVRNVLSILEQQYVVVTLISDLLDRGMSVSIGAENKLQPLAHCSIVVAPTMVDGEQRGSVAVLGPTRMDYGQAMAAVSMVSRRLGQRLTEGQG